MITHYYVFVDPPSEQDVAFILSSEADAIDEWYKMDLGAKLTPMFGYIPGHMGLDDEERGKFDFSGLTSATKAEAIALAEAT